MKKRGVKKYKDKKTTFYYCHRYGKVILTKFDDRDKNYKYAKSNKINDFCTGHMKLVQYDNSEKVELR